MYQHLINDVLGEERASQTQQLEQEGDKEDIFQEFAVFADHRHKPAKTEFACFFLHFVAAGKEDSLPRPHFQHLFGVGMDGVLRKGWVDDVHFPIFQIVGDDEAVAVFHANKDGEYHLGQVFFRQPAVFTGTEFQITGRPHKGVVVHPAFFEHIGAFELAVVGGYVVGFRNADKGKQACVVLFCHSLSLP